jgi:hypothetical protein
MWGCGLMWGMWIDVEGCAHPEQLETRNPQPETRNFLPPKRPDQKVWQGLGPRRLVVSAALDF